MKRILVILLIIVVGSYFLITRPRAVTEYEYSDADQTSVSWKVGLAFPSSSLEVFDRSTVGRWSMIADVVREDLMAHGFQDQNIIIKQSDKRTDQVQQIDELVRTERVDALITVPVELTRDETVALYGDPVTPYLREKWAGEVAKSVAANDPLLLEKSPYTKIDVETPLDVNALEYFTKLLTKLNERTIEQALNDARNAGVYTVGFGNDTLNNYPFSYFFATPSPEDFANVQAGFAVAHLGLPELEPDGTALPPPADWAPKNAEILVADGVRSTSKRFFDTLWGRMKPYFDAGYLHSNSGLLTPNTTFDDYISVAVTEDGDKAAGVMHNILDKYYKEEDLTHNLAIIFAQSDALSRGAVRACVESGWSVGDQKWPIITGSGAEKITAQDIVENKQAMSIGYDSKALARGVSQLLTDYAKGEDVGNFDSQITNNEILKDALEPEKGTLYLANYEIQGGFMRSLIARPITITNDNIKSFLIDNNYIKSQDAGL